MLNYFRIFLYCLIFHKSDFSQSKRSIATLAETPFVVSIRYKETPKDFGKNHFCAGSLITCTAVISGGRCLKAGSSPGDYLLVMGTLNKNERTDTTLAYKARKYIIHERYDPKNYNNDIMIFFLSGRVSKNHIVRPIALTDRAFPKNPSCYIYGWQTLLPSQITSQLFRGGVYLISDRECSNQYTNISFDEFGYTCGVSSQDSCVGDYGGPLVCDKKLTGMVSWTWGTSCFDTEYPGVYTDIHFYRTWIKTNIEHALNPDPSNENTISSTSTIITIEYVLFYIFYFAFFNFI